MQVLCPRPETGARCLVMLWRAGRNVAAPGRGCRQLPSCSCPACPQLAPSLPHPLWGSPTSASSSCCLSLLKTCAGCERWWRGTYITKHFKCKAWLKPPFRYLIFLKLIALLILALNSLLYSWKKKTTTATWNLAETVSVENYTTLAAMKWGLFFFLIKCYIKVKLDSY